MLRLVSTLFDLGKLVKKLGDAFSLWPTKKVSSLIILVSLLGNCSTKKGSLAADQFGLHCSITEIRSNLAEC